MRLRSHDANQAYEQQPTVLGAGEEEDGAGRGRGDGRTRSDGGSLGCGNQISPRTEGGAHIGGSTPSTPDGALPRGLPPDPHPGAITPRE